MLYTCRFILFCVVHIIEGFVREWVGRESRVFRGSLGQVAVGFVVGDLWWCLVSEFGFAGAYRLHISAAFRHLSFVVPSGDAASVRVLDVY